MKNFLPKTKYSIKGFTLVELLIVISIIAVLATIGFAIYSNLGTGPKARNITRRADLDSIAKVLEVNKVAGGNYAVLANSQFANGKIPTTDSLGYSYCAYSAVSTAKLPSNPTASWNTPPAATPGTCPTVVTLNDGTVGSYAYSAVSSSVPSANAAWKVCTWLEAEVNPVKAAGVFCKLSAQ